MSLPEPRAVVVTGAASGLGAAVAGALLESGYRPWSLDLHGPTGDLEGERVDLGDSLAAEGAVARAAEMCGGLRAVVTAAGIDACGEMAQVATSDWERVIRVNLLGTAAVVRAALPHLELSRGRVVTVASTLGLRALPAATAYCASKFGVVGFTRALAAEMAGRVGVTLLIPGGMRTHFFDEREERFKPPQDAQLNEPANVAAAVVFALAQPAGCEIRELVVTPSQEPSWP